MDNNNNNVDGGLPADKPKRKTHTSGAEFDQIKYQNDFIRQNYDRINLTIPKNRGETWRTLAAAEGKSVNAFVRDAVESHISANFPPEQLPED